MQRTTIYIVVLIAAGLIATAFTIFTPIFGVILLAILAGIAFVLTVGKRSREVRKARDFGEQGQGGVEFSERDRETLTPSGRGESTGG